MQSLGHARFLLAGMIEAELWRSASLSTAPKQWRGPRWLTACPSASTCPASPPSSLRSGGIGFLRPARHSQRVVNADPDSWCRGDRDSMGRENHDEWREAMRDPDVVRAMLEDCRAGLTVRSCP
jgi:haloacetate dehalogenase